jgi:hypothetical protein
MEFPFPRQQFVDAIHQMTTPMGGEGRCGKSSEPAYLSLWWADFRIDPLPIAPELWKRSPGLGPGSGLLPDKPLMHSRRSLEHGRALRVNPKLGSFRQIWNKIPFCTNIFAASAKQRCGSRLG